MSFTDETTTWENEPTEWNATGVEPTTELKEKGFTAGYKPPADFFNHLFNKIYVSIKELQNKVATRAEIQTELDKKANSTHTHNYAGSSSAGGAATTALECTGNAATATKATTADYATKAGSADTATTATKANSATTAGTCTGNAATATKATQDGSGNIITSTYGTKVNPAFTGTFSHNRLSGSTVGEESFAAGTNATASGQWSVALGRKAKATGQLALATGYETTSSGLSCTATGHATTASGSYSHSTCCETTASGIGSMAMCFKTKSAGDYSASMGYYTNANGSSAVAAGWETTALDMQLVIGMLNDTSLATTKGVVYGAHDGTAFVIGNGSSTAKSNAFRVRYDGAVYSKGAYNNSGADYAEYFEWADGNPNNEDRRGFAVTFDEEKTNKIRKANANDDVIGIISGNPCILGNADEGWLGQYLRDEFGTILTEETEEEIESIDTKTGEKTTEKTKSIFYILNPDYDPTQEYISREKRKEWAAVGLFGVLAVRDDNTSNAGGYCKVTDGGTVTTAERGIDTYRVLERVTDNIVKVLFIP